MAPGIGSRKVLSPRSDKVPRRSLPAQAKLIEAASFESVELGQSSPDILTTKLHEKIKKNNNLKLTNNNQNSQNNNNIHNNSKYKMSSFNERLNAASMDASSSSSSALMNNAGRSKLSMEEVNGEYFERENVRREKERELERVREREKDRERLLVSKERERERERNRERESERIGSHHNNSSSSNNNNNSYYNTYNNNNSSNNSISNTSFKSNYSRDAAQMTNVLNTNMINPNSSSYNNSNNNNSYNRNINNSNSSFNSNINSTNDPATEMLQDQLNFMKREYEGLKQRFTELSRLRTTESELFLEEYKKRSEARDVAADRTIKALQLENDRLKKQVREGFSVAAVENLNVKERERFEKEKERLTTVGSQSESSTSKAAELSSLTKILKIYSGFTGLTIKPLVSFSESNAADMNESFSCEFSSRSGRFFFSLKFDPHTHHYQYIPDLDDNDDHDNDLDHHHTNNINSLQHNLPAFLTDDILITPDQMQIFFWRLLDTLTKVKSC